MIRFEYVEEPPIELSPKAQEAWARSTYVWRAWYGPATGLDDHIHLGYLGLVPLDYLTQRGYWWFDLGEGRPTRTMLREAKQAFAALNAQLGWETYAQTELSRPNHLRFARSFGFHVMGQTEDTTYLRRQ